MSSENPLTPREELEAQLTALILGELPPDQAFALGQEIQKDPELATLYSRLLKTVELVRETAANPPEESSSATMPLKMSGDRREKLLAQFKTVEPKEFSEPRRPLKSWLLPIAAAAAILLLASILLLNRGQPSFSAHTARLAAFDTLKDGSDLSPESWRYQPPLAQDRERLSRQAGATVAAPSTPPANQAVTMTAGGGGGGSSGGQTLWNSLDGSALSTAPARPTAAPVGFANSGTLSPNRNANIALPSVGDSDSAAIAVNKPQSGATAEDAISIGGRVDIAGTKTPFAGDPEFVGGLDKPALEPAKRGFGEGSPGEKPVAMASTEGKSQLSSESGIAQVTRLNSEESLRERSAGMTTSAPSRGIGGGGIGGFAGSGRLPAAQPTPLPLTALNTPPVASADQPSDRNELSKSLKDGTADKRTSGKVELPRVAEAIPAPSVAFAVPMESAVATPPAGQNRGGEMVAALGTDTKDISGHDASPPVTLSYNDSAPLPTASAPEQLSPRDQEVRRQTEEAFRKRYGLGAPKSAPGGPSIAAAPSPTPPPQPQLILPQEDAEAVRQHSRFSVAGPINSADFAFQNGQLQPSADGRYQTFDPGGNAAAPKAAVRSPTPPQDAMQLSDFGMVADSEAQIRQAKENPTAFYNYQSSPAAPSKEVPANKQVETFQRLLDAATNTPQAGGVSSGAGVGGLPPDAVLTWNASAFANGNIPIDPATGLPTAPAAQVSGEFKTSSNDIAKAEQARPYFEKKRELEDLTRSRQLLAMKLSSESIDSALPKTATVQIAAPAEPEATPSFGAKLKQVFTGKVERKARVKLEPDQPDINRFSEKGSASAYDPYFVQNEFEVMNSESVLGKVVDNLDLQNTWAERNGGKQLSKQQAVALLKKNLDLKPVQKTSLVEVGFKDEKPEEAAKVANAVADAYANYRQEERKKLNAGTTQALEAQYKEQGVKIAKAQKELDELGQQLKAAKPATAPPGTGQATAPAKQEIDVAKRTPSTNAPIPQPEIQTRDNAFSTFSLNVSDVSFKLAAASLEKGAMPDPAGIRTEEFINAFDYRDPEPPAGVPVAFAWERAHDPFAQNRDLLRFSIKTAAQGRQAGRPLNIVLLLDNSGSMERADRVRIIHEALRVLGTQLQPQDKLSVMTFARTPRLLVDGVPGNQAGQVADMVSGLTPEGGTNLEDAMNQAYEIAMRHYLPNGINRVVLLTDGAANLGNVDPESLKQKVEARRKQGFALDCFGIGWEGYNDDLLEVLSRNGDGRYGFINSPEEAATEFAGQLAGALQVAASDVKVQVEFNPGRVTAYRQIGYAKHQLTKEQFRDNTVDAAEIGAAEAGNALYAVEVNAAGDGPLAIVRVRFKVPGTSDYREHAWPVPYNGNAVSMLEATPAMRLAATSSAFAEWLAVSPYAQEVAPDELLRYLAGVPDVYGADARPKKLEWMIRQARSIGGK